VIPMRINIWLVIIVVFIVLLLLGVVTITIR
jgi:flagellar basal body-associated protein FliL